MRILTYVIATIFYVAVSCQLRHHRNSAVGMVWRNISANIPEKWLLELLQEVHQEPQTLHPVLFEFQQLIETNTRIYMLFQSMFQEIGNCPYEVQSSQELLQVLNHIITRGPAWSDDLLRADRAGLSILAVIGRVKSTVSGVAAFLDPQVDAMVGRVLDAWGEFLRSPASAVVLNNSSGWFSGPALQHLTNTANAEISNYTFEELFVSDPAAPYYGFRSWDDFFTRSFREGIRPVASADDDSVITNACEHTPTNVVHGVKLRDQFWIKGRHYSVLDMLGHDNRAMADLFVGGTAYQGLLSALGYHRWHAPVSGRIAQAYILDGMHYAPLVYSDGRLVELAESEYGAAMSTRAVILIEADNPAIGMVAFIAVGLAEVSTCEMRVSAGQYVKKGDQLGMFHYGGSTHCLLFRAEVNLTGFPDMGRTEHVPVRSRLATVQT
ncbi:Phophatidylserine decarboxylase-domain-containing protein [Aspergillus floccosus]